MDQRGPDSSELFDLADARYHRLLNLCPDIVFCLSNDFRIVRLNPAFEALTGWPAADRIGQPFLSLIHEEEETEILGRLHETLSFGSVPFFEARMKTASGGCLTVEVLFSSDGEPEGRRGIVGLARDLTKSKRAEEALIHREAQLQQAQKMEAIGRLAGGIAHDFNNLLTIITGYSQLVLSRLGSEDQLRSDVEEIRKAAVRAADLTQQLLAFSRRQMLSPKILNLNAAVENVATMLQRLIGEDVHLVTVLDPELGQVKADPGQIEQVLMNLAVNARDAMPTGGKLTIETANVDITEPVHTDDAALPAGRYAMMSVNDTGCGMDVKTRARIFEPFFTTKEQGKGTGLGLSTVYGIVKQSGGHILVNSKAGHGTTFKLYLPLVNEPVQLLEIEKHPVASLYGTETVLLVEDEPTVRVLIRDTLRRFGYTVLGARHGVEAQLIYTQHPRIDLLITDVVMPQMSGRELADRLLEIDSKLKILFMSGYTESAVIHHGVTGASTTFIQKPFTPEALARQVRETLDAGTAPQANVPAAG
jgi:PAS domain S-box-containing protein